MLFETERFELIQFLATADLDDDEYDVIDDAIECIDELNLWYPACTLECAEKAIAEAKKLMHK